MRISVITVCHNSASYLEQTITSVLGQSYRDLEYIIVDGGSCDATVQIIKAHAARDPRVRWVSEPDGGISDAMNKGVRMASGEIVAHLHSDDFYPHERVLEAVASAWVEHGDPHWLTGGVHLVDREGRFLREVKVRRYSCRRLIHSNILLHPATFVRRTSFLACGGFDTSLSFCMDYHLWLRLGALGNPILVPQALASFRVHGGSRSTAQAAAAYAEEFRVRCAFLEERGLWRLPYRIEYLVKRHLNRLFMNRLAASADGATGGDA
ncbi:glycosyltransferase [Geomonas sp. RF6]|uniref:glycosyltransferase family 2 protein n=1 Tax=Geomonas sp. RF6 TaxID=2897342 RepID=UPI001E541244|nr:glycosyltransferase family 2 protein [Geomonas sp. RF6]UFS69719.1 glycosyltransferase [Geomonas sp. RF6]